MKGNVQMGDASALTPGSDVGILSFDGNLTLSATSVFNFQLGSNAIPGTTYDQIKVLSATNYNLLDLGVNLINFSNFSFTLLPGFGDGDYVLFDAPTTGMLGSSLSGWIGSALGTIAIDPYTSAVVLTVSTVPEPGTVALLSVAGLAAAATVLRRRRR